MFTNTNTNKLHTQIDIVHKKLANDKEIDDETISALQDSLIESSYESSVYNSLNITDKKRLIIEYLARKPDAKNKVVSTIAGCVISYPSMVKEELNPHIEDRANELESMGTKEAKDIDYRNITPCDVNPVAFDLETTGLNISDTITAVGFMRNLTVGSEEVYKIIIYVVATDFDAQQLSDELEPKVEAHDLIDKDVDVTVIPVENESKLVGELTDNIGGIVNGENDILTTFSGYNYRGGFDYPALSNATIYADSIEEHPLRGIAHFDIQEHLDHKRICNFKTEEYTVNSLSKSLNKSPFKKLVGDIKQELIKNIQRKHNATVVDDTINELDRLMCNYNNKTPREEIEQAVEDIDSDIEYRELIGLCGLELVESSKGGTENNLRLIDDIFELDYIQDCIRSYYEDNGLNTPTTTKTKLDGIYHTLTTRGEGHSDSIDPLGGDSSKAPKVYDEGNYEDLCLHLIDDLWMTLFLANKVQLVTPSYEFKVNVF